MATGAIPAETTTYVGRGSEIDEIRALLGSAHLVTLTGPGGVGKTRLALRVAAAVGSAFHGNVSFVELAELREPDLLVSTVATRLGLGDKSTGSPLDLLTRQLRDRRMLIILDNCEHMVGECARLVDALMRHCPDVVVLATSRQSLNVAGEQLVPVHPFSVPEPGVSPEQVISYDSVRLLIDRATAAMPSFAVTADNAGDIARLSRMLDGLPLAIELAAVRLRSLSAGQLADRLDKRFRLLVGGRRVSARQQTFQALIDWSYELCTEQEKLLWARISVFPGGFDLDAAEEICAGGGLDRGTVLDVLDALIDKSILLREGKNVARYRMLETMRQYGDDRLADMGEQREFRRRHRDYYLRLTDKFFAEWFGPDQIAWAAWLDREHANLRLALDFCTSDPVEATSGLRMAANVWNFWVRVSINEGRIWVRRLLDVAPDDAPGMATGLWLHGFFAALQGDTDTHDALDAAAEIAERTGDEMSAACVKVVRATGAMMLNRPDLATPLLENGVATLKRLGYHYWAAWASFDLGMSLGLEGRIDRSREVVDEALAICVERGDLFMRSWTLYARSAAEYAHGDTQVAHDAAIEVLRLQRILNDRLVIGYALTNLAGCAARTGDPRRAARLSGAASSVWHAMGTSIATLSAFSGHMQDAANAVTQALGQDAAIKEFLSGAAMTVGDAISYALGEDASEPAPAAAPAQPDNGLTRRETEIAALVARGMTNREIAAQFVIAPRTVESHINHIMTKLGFNNRAQIAAWFVQSGLS